MRESQQAHLLTQYVENLKHNPDALPPTDLDGDMADFARKLAESQSLRRTRVWSQVLAETAQNIAAGGRNVQNLNQNTFFDETTTMTDYTLFDDYRTPHFPQTQKKRQTFPLTLAVATLAMILGIAVMIAIRSLPEGDNTPYAAQISGNQIASTTMVASIVPTSTPFTMTNAPIELSLRSAGDLRNERILIRNLGNTLDLSGWSLSDANGLTYILPDDRRLFNDGSLAIYSTSGTNTPVNVYWGLDSALFSDGSNIVTLYDADGNAVSSVSNEISNLQPTVMPTTTPPQLCNVIPLDNSGGARVRNMPDQTSAVQIATLPEGTIAGVFEMVRSADGVIWYRIRADIDDAQISGWVMMDAISEVDTPCPGIPGSQVMMVTTTPIGRLEVTIVPTVVPDVNTLMSGYDYLPVVIAGLDIPQGTLITETMLAVVYMPVSTVQDMVSRNGTVISGMATFREGARYATEDIARWQPLFMTQLAEGGGGGGN